jgi:uncharacterized protein (DUF433 family)
MNRRIIIDPQICHGKPVIEGTRVLVSNILADLANGAIMEDIVNNYPNITKEDIQAALSFGSELAQFETYSIEMKS